MSCTSTRVSSIVDKEFRIIALIYLSVSSSPFSQASNIMNGCNNFITLIKFMYRIETYNKNERRRDSSSSHVDVRSLIKTTPTTKKNEHLTNKSILVVSCFHIFHSKQFILKLDLESYIYNNDDKKLDFSTQHSFTLTYILKEEKKTDTITLDKLPPKYLSC